MNSTSTFNLFGRLTSTPELKTTPTGKSVISFFVAENRRFKINDEVQEKALYHRFEYWGREAEHYAKYLSKGMPVTILGATPTHKEHITEGGYKINETVFRGGNIIFHPVKTVRYSANEDEVPMFLAEESNFHADNVPF